MIEKLLAIAINHCFRIFLFSCV